MYDTTAFLYESTAAFEQPEQVCDLLLANLDKYGQHPPGLLGDLGSGTGLMSILLAEKGWRIHGVELSPAMIAVARQKAAHLPDEIQARLHWEHGDISQFTLSEGDLLDGAVCLCNTINHLAEWEQVEGFIRSAFQALRPGGVLILDSDRLETFQGFFNHPPTVVFEDETHRFTRACRFEESSGRAEHLATVERRTPMGWQLISKEPMSLQYHQESKLNQAFLAAGFKLENAEPFNPYPSLYEGLIPKVLWTFRKP